MLNSVCIYDLAGSAVDLARVLSKTVPKVFYYKGWQQGGFPTPNVHLVGTGIPGVTRVDDFEKMKRTEQIDLYIFSDIYHGSLQEELQAQGKLVIGSRSADKFEIYRDESRKLLKLVGLPVNAEYEEMRGITALREFLKTHKDQYVKINKHRGLAETFRSIDYDLIELYLDNLQHMLGSHKEDKLFMVEGKYPAGMVEAGMDIYTADGKVPDIVMAGIEKKDLGYVCIVKPYIDFPECMRVVIDKLLPVFGEMGVRGPFSYEAKIGKELKPHVLDFTQRFGQPPGPLQWLMYKNLLDMLRAIADGVPMSPTGHKKYGIEITIESEYAKKETLTVRIPKDVRDNVFLSNYRMIDGKDDLYYVVPQPEEIKEIGSVVAEGDTLEECKARIKEVCDKIEAFDIDFSVDAIDDLDKEIEKLDEFGINFYKDEKPTTEEISEVQAEPLKTIENIIVEPEKPKVINQLSPKVNKFLQKIKA